MKKILLVDGMALLFRGYYATAYRGNFMKTTSGMPTNGIFQFIRYLRDAIEQFTPTHVICCWDMGSKTFRTELYDQYKANRDAPPKELIPQFDLVKKVVDAFDMPNIGLENYEADDCIGTLTNAYKAEHQIIILSGDHDLLQLVDDHVDVAIMLKGQGNYDMYNKDNFYDKKGFHPWQLVDMKGLMGDSADNYPGVKGIGEVTALKLIREYDSIDNILDNLDHLPDGMRKRIENNIDMLHLSRQLATIKCDVPIECRLKNTHWTYDQHKVKKTLEAWELDHFIHLL